MSSVFLEENEHFTVANSSKIFGSSANEVIIIQSDVSNVILDQNIERVDFPLNSSDYSYQQTGNTLLIFLNQILITTIPLQSDGSQIVFADVSVSAILSTGIISMGGVVVPSDTAKNLTFINVDNDTTSNSAAQFTLSTTTNTVDEGQAQIYTLSSSVANTQELSFNYSLSPSGNNPVSAVDFSSATSGILTLPSNTTSTTLSVNIRQDDIDEFAENFSLIITDSAGKQIATLDSIINNIKASDSIAPIITTPSSTVKYTENQQTNTPLTTITASDNIAVDQFLIVSGNAEGFFSINSQGEIRLSTVGLQGASNDFEVLPNSFSLGLSASDAANNVSNIATINFIVEDDNSDNSSSATFSLSRDYYSPLLSEGLMGIILAETEFA